MNKGYYILFVLAVFLYVTCQCGIAQKEGDKTVIIVTSAAFEEGGFIPAKYTCDSLNISPPLGWQHVPQTAKSFALICDDPDAPMGTWVHWVVWNIPPDANGLAENIPTTNRLSDGSRQGVTSARKHGYHGPCPPSGTHRYYFKIYALDCVLDLPDSSQKQDLLNAMKEHILAEGALMGRYERRTQNSLLR